MYLSFTFGATALLASTVLGESVILCNCKDGNGIQSSEMAYYGGDPNASPAAIATVATDYDKTAVWEGSSKEATFPDGNIFTSLIPKPVEADAFAGTGSNKYQSFYCYYKNSGNTFTSGGKTCSTIYVCNHNAPEVHVSFSIDSNYVEIPAQTTAHDIYWAVWNRRQERDCDPSPYGLSGGCSITFECHGADSWNTTNGMAKTLVDVVASQNGVTSQRSERSNDCNKYCGSPNGGFCCSFVTNTLWYTKLPRSVTIRVDNTDTNSERGQLKYTLSCPNSGPSQSCQELKVLRYSLSLLGPLSGELGAFFGMTNAIIAPINDAACS